MGITGLHVYARWRVRVNLTWSDLGVWLTPFYMVGLMMVPITIYTIYKRRQR